MFSLATRTAASSAARAGVFRAAVPRASYSVMSNNDDEYCNFAELMVSVDRDEGTATVTFARPKSLNALCESMMTELNRAFKMLDADDSVRAIVLTGDNVSFAAGADIKEMAKQTYPEALRVNFLAHWTDAFKISKPVIAAVRGHALGGGCEVAMMCDIIYASTDARFAQPEVRLGTIPGAGGTQRLVRAVGKSRAMELCLTGDVLTANEACSLGLVSKVFQPDEVLGAAQKLARKIASQSAPVVKLIKEAVNASQEMSLEAGLAYERRLFHSTFSLDDQKEGMAAFIEKRPAKFTNQ
ncbi:enoyl-CoA hydratase [Fonticula alba]|uniref:Probable enoyl-CoA hydratase, mitochondrial n=1 Tax=Fonticula alba TaxID=691883 RepID=A0A058ZET3_FONAL|nr:enoyl-CoA hydratase [Fonticula alba]KCV72884.1 enoyl-CoA hydratase [Fonticula alba]|eukprot:XP_009492585.1 enoyl-CoA hydratase [Fonticula alba]